MAEIETCVGKLHGVVKLNGDVKSLTKIL